jgi:hypothetical protein
VVQNWSATSAGQFSGGGGGVGGAGGDGGGEGGGGVGGWCVQGHRRWKESLVDAKSQL